MNTILLSVFLFFALQPVDGQIKQSSKRWAADSNWTSVEDLPMVLLNEETTREMPMGNTASLLTANRDAFYAAAAFQFSSQRFRIRGYEGAFFQTYLNGLPMNDLIDGNTPWAWWGGLNDVMRNTVLAQGLRNNDFSFGALGTTTSIDARASRQRKQTQFSYALSNRSFTHRWTFSYATGMRPNGWALALSGSRRYAKEGYTSGNFFEGHSYFLAVEKKFDERHSLSLTLFGAPTYQGKQAPVTKEVIALAGPRYNPYWGYQAGRKRNANTGSLHQPVVLLTHNLQLDNHTKLISGIGLMMGEKISTGLDWYKASDPRPDYYRNLPSFQTDSLLQHAVASAFQGDANLRQLNWESMYEVNRQSLETIQDANGIVGQTISGLRSHYILEDRVQQLKRFQAATNFTTLLGNMTVSAGLQVQVQQVRYFKRVHDLLGGEFYVDWNQFAERDFPNDPVALQNDLNHPNRILRRGDRFGYHYTVQQGYMAAWLQAAVVKKRFDFFGALQLSNTYYWREGQVQSGLFVVNSMGKSIHNEFTDIASKGGITYKINGRKYIYLHAAFLTKAPLFDNVFISPRTRNTQQEQVVSEKMITAEAGYILNTPTMKIRLTGYLTKFSDGMNVLNFYHDGYHNLVNNAISNIDKIHMGVEFGAELILSPVWSFSTAAAYGHYRYTSRQSAVVTQDNDASLLERDLVFSKNFRVAGTPQQAASVSFRYQAGQFFVQLTGNYFAQQWIEFNPLRRTYGALQGVAKHSEQWNQIIHQTRLPSSFNTAMFTGISIRLPKDARGNERNLFCSASINNLLNNQHILSGGYEQLRFDLDEKNTEKFPPKFFYAYGLNYSINLTLRM